MATKVVLGPPTNVREVLIRVISKDGGESIWDLPKRRHDRTYREIDYYPGLSGRGGEYVYYDPWVLRKIDRWNF